MDSLAELFAWAVGQAEAARSIPPLAIHQASYPRDHSGEKCLLCPNGVTCIHKGMIIRARPFTVAFEKYVDDDEPDPPIVKALGAIGSDPSMRLEFEITWAVVHGGHTDPELLYGILGRPNGFDAAARRGLGLLRDKTTHIVQQRVAATAERRVRAGEAEQVRKADAGISSQVATKIRRRKRVA